MSEPTPTGPEALTEVEIRGIEDQWRQGMGHLGDIAPMCRRLLATLRQKDAEIDRIRQEEGK